MRATRFTKSSRHLLRDMVRTFGYKPKHLLKKANKKALAITFIAALMIQLTVPFLSFSPDSNVAYAAGNTYYVSPNGSDSNSGSESAPFRTIGKAHSVARAGDTVYVRSGTYNESITHGYSGTAGAPITFKNYPGESPILNGGGTRGSAVNFNSKSYIRWEGFEVTNYNGNGVGAFHFNDGNCSNNAIVNCYIHDTQSGNNAGHGITSAWSAGAGSNHLIENNRITAVPGKGMLITNAPNLVIRGNTIWNIHHDAIYMTGNMDNLLVEGNHLRDATAIDGDHVDLLQYSNGGTITSQNWHIRNNLFGKASEHQVIIGSVDNINVYNNIWYDGCTGSGSSSGVAFRLKGVGYAKVYNNTVVDLTTNQVGIVCSTRGEADGRLCKSPRIYNNIILGTTSARAVVNGDGGNPDFQEGYNAKSGDPATFFVNQSTRDYHLKSGSAAIDTGTNTPPGITLPSTDRDGKIRIVNNKIDLGAYEYGAASDVTRPVDDITPQDTVVPTVSISAPADGTLLRGQASIKASATDDKEIQKAEFYIDGALKNTATTSPYEYIWDSTTVADGAHKVLIKAYDTSNNTASAEITVNVDNSISDIAPPAVPDVIAPVTVIADPTGGETLTGSKKLIKGTTTDDVAIDKVEISIQKEDGTYWTGSDWSTDTVWLSSDNLTIGDAKTATWDYLWQIPSSDNLTYKIKARGTDTSGNIEGTALSTVQVDNVAPTGSISIDSAVESTTDETVTIANAVTGATKMRFSTDGSTWTEWEDYAATKELRLSGGPTVWAQFSDGANVYETSYNIKPTSTVSITHPAGWNMVAAPDGADLRTAALYTYRMESYAAARSIAPGVGYWAYYERPTTISMTFDIKDSFDVELHPGWNMVGNPFDRDIAVPTGYEAYIYNPSTGDYKTTDIIPIGRSVWMQSSDDRTITLSR